jgi:hypothetical protein
VNVCDRGTQRPQLRVGRGVDDQHRRVLAVLAFLRSR